MLLIKCYLLLDIDFTQNKKTGFGRMEERSFLRFNLIFPAKNNDN